MWIKTSCLKFSYRFRISLVLFCLASLLITCLQPVKATNDFLTTTKFAYGARIDPWGEQVEFSLKSYSSSGLDWLGIDFDWKKYWADQNASLDLTRLERVMTYAKAHDIKVLFSVTNPPDWVLTDTGPDPVITSGLIAQLVRLFPDSLKAVELFPSANTRQGWGAKPNPQTYASLLKNVSEMLQASGARTVLVAAGLTPIDIQKNPGDMDDLHFLDQLYLNGAAQYMPIIGVRFHALSGEPLDAPSSPNSFVIRHYELIRNEMREHDHSNGLIWITGFSFPEISPNHPLIQNLFPGETKQALANYQSYWLNHAFYVMKSQLYLGAAFFDCLNPPGSGAKQDQRCLIRNAEGHSSLHPAFSALSDMISLENSYQDQVNHSGNNDIGINSILTSKWSSP